MLEHYVSLLFFVFPDCTSEFILNLTLTEYGVAYFSKGYRVRK